ncbi:hypothetical protein [Thalassobellus suaedae]|uniref:Tetratricopeptide repeat protein n=1 Tax=Thalassobellus suaedae TaxID=3074124 RepID=A0ABY9XSY8_9FLAO|nr:hypothetical protein RHP51_18830 [Flavobacteriaceae bacterium HL-DH14]
MNQTDFTYILQHPQAIAHQQTDAIKSIVDEFPYFQSARAVYLKGLKNQSSFKYNQELKTTAAYTTDRSILFDYITSDEFVQNEISQFIKKNTSHLKDIDVDIEDISINKSVTIDDALRQQIKDTDGVLDPALFEAKEKRLNSNAFVLDESESIETVTEETKTQDVSASEILSLGKPLQFEKRETHSFNEWLKITSFKPIIREEIEEPLKIVKTKKTSTSKDKVKKFELIDKFITQNPKINPKKSTSSKGNLAKAQMIQPESLMTETLARIYVEQKNYKKAIQSYRILSLKYPEKSSFFANQIKAVEQLQEHNNKE